RENMAAPPPSRTHTESSHESNSMKNREDSFPCNSRRSIAKCVVLFLTLSIVLPATASRGSHSTGRSSRHSSSRAGKSKGNHYSRRATSSSVKRDKHGRIKRSSAAKHSFERQHPCPSTGRTSGRCPGYVVDHVRPLECGGADAPSNMQWQTVAAGKAKDRTEGTCR